MIETKEIDTNQLVHEVIGALIKIPEECKNKTDPEWTFHIKKSLEKIADNHGLRCSFTDKKNKKKEWLHDFIMYDMINDDEFGKDSKRLGKVYLCAESEWKVDIDEIQEDFEKLLVAKAKIKLMIYCRMKEWEEWMRRLVEKSEIDIGGEIYILAAYDESAFFIEQYEDGRWSVKP